MDVVEESGPRWSSLPSRSCVRALFAYWGRGYLVESWWISRLGSGDRAIRVQAAGELAERKCLRAVPRIVDAIAEDPQEGITTRAVNFNRAHDGPDASVHIDEASTVCCLLRAYIPHVPELLTCNFFRRA
jgi:hypothetical protein